MNAGTVIAIVLLALVGGAGMLAMGIFFWYLLKTMRSVEKSIGEFVRVLDPLVKTGSLQQLSGAAATLVGLAKQALLSMHNINQTVAVFNRGFFDSEKLGPLTPAAPPADFAQEGESAVYSSSEEGAAQQEAAADLRKMGIETDATRVIEDPEKMHG